jgi:hypothetical protein
MRGVQMPLIAPVPPPNLSPEPGGVVYTKRWVVKLLLVSRRWCSKCALTHL